MMRSTDNAVIGYSYSLLHIVPVKSYKANRNLKQDMWSNRSLWMVIAPSLGLSISFVEQQ